MPDLLTPGDVSTVMTPCPEGFYCPNGTHYDWQSCPAGTYSNVKTLYEAVQCTPCDAGKYCSGEWQICCSVSNEFLSLFCVAIENINVLISGKIGRILHLLMLVAIECLFLFECEVLLS